MPIESRSRKALDGILWTFSGTGFQLVVQILVLAIFARLLSPKDFGIVSAAGVIIGISSMFSQLGIGPAIVQRQNLNHEHIAAGFTISVFVGIFFTLFIWLIAPIVSLYFKIKELTFVLRIMSVVFIFQGLSVVAQSLLHRDLRFRYLSIVEFLSYTLGYGVVGVTLAYFKYGVWSLVFAQLGQTLISCILYNICRPHTIKFYIDFGVCNELLRYGVGFSLTNIFNYFARNGDYMVIGRFLGAENLGFYNRAYKLMMLPATIIGNAVDKVLFPTLSKIQENKERMSVVYKRGLSSVALLSFPMSVAMIILAPEIIYTILGSQWMDAVGPFRILTIGAFFRTSYKISATVIRSLGEVYREARLQFVYAFLVIVGAFLGKGWGISGVAVGVLFALACIFLLLSGLCCKLLPITRKEFFFSHVPGMLLGLVIMAELFILLHVMKLFNVSQVFVLIYSMIVLSLTIITIGYINNRTLLGENGIWLREMLMDYINNKTG